MILKRLSLCPQRTIFWCLTCPWRAEIEQWALDWGQNPTDSCPGDRTATGNRELDVVPLGNTSIPQEQGSQVVSLLCCLAGWKRWILSVRIEWHFWFSYKSGAGVVRAEGCGKLGALSFTAWSSVAVCYLGQVCFPLSACPSSCTTCC